MLFVTKIYRLLDSAAPAPSSALPLAHIYLSPGWSNVVKTDHSPSFQPSCVSFTALDPSWISTGSGSFLLQQKYFKNWVGPSVLAGKLRSCICRRRYPHRGTTAYAEKIQRCTFNSRIGRSSSSHTCSAQMTDRQMQDHTPARNLALTYLAREVAVCDQYPVGKNASPSLADTQYVVAER